MLNIPQISDSSMYGMLDRNSRNRGHNPSAHLERNCSAPAAQLQHTWSATTAQLQRNYSTTTAQLQHNCSSTPRAAPFIFHHILDSTSLSRFLPESGATPYAVPRLSLRQTTLCSSGEHRTFGLRATECPSTAELGLFSDYSRNIPDYSRITLVLPRQRGLDQCCEFETMHVTVIFSRPADHEVDMLALADRDGRTRNNMLQMMEMVQKVSIIEFDFVNMASSLRNRRPRHTSKTVIVPVSAFFRQSGTALELMHVTLRMSYRFRKSRSGCYPRGTLFLLHRQEGLLTILGFPPSLY
jgi:hypothetical protein